MTTGSDPYLDFLRGAGVVFDTAAEVVAEPDHEGRPHPDGAPVRELVLDGLPAIREHRDPERAVSACHATISVARAMTRPGVLRRGDPFWDVGCGTGVLSIVAAQLGAAPVRATDVDPGALALARRNAEAAGAAIDVSERSLLGAADGARVHGLVTTNLPHKPSREPGVLPLAQDGGPEGDRLFSTMLDQADERFAPGARLLFFLHSLPHPRLLARVGREYHLTLLSRKRRFLEPGEYGDLQEWFVERHRAGTSYVATTADGRRYLACGVWLAERR